MDTYSIGSTVAEQLRAFKKKSVTEVIRKRRSIYADEFTGQNISEDILQEILINATWAPTHKMTEPWRFIVFQGEYLKDFGNYMAEYYKDYYQSILSEEDFLIKYKYLKEYPLKASCMIGVIMVRNEKIKLPEWEEIAAVACAVQNIALTCVDYDMGGYWCTTEAAIEYVALTGLQENEKSLGIFFIGHCNEVERAESKKRRSPIEKKVTVLK